VCNDNYHGRSYCLARKCSRAIEHCLTKSSSHSARARAPFLFLISITGCCGPCGVVGDAPASSKRSGKSTGLWGKPRCPARRRACAPGRRHRYGVRCAFWGCLRFIVIRYVTVLRRAAAAPAQTAIIRLRHGAPRRLFPATLVACSRRSQSQAPPLGSRRPVAARLLAATL
jgi:hypothetical protein